MASLLISNTPTSSSCPGTRGWQRDGGTRWRGICGGVWWRGVKSEVCDRILCKMRKHLAGLLKILHTCTLYVVCVIILSEHVC